MNKHLVLLLLCLLLVAAHVSAYVEIPAQFDTEISVKANTSETTKYMFTRADGPELDFDVIMPSRDFVFVAKDLQLNNPFPQASVPRATPLGFFSIEVKTLEARPDYNCVLRYFYDVAKLNGASENSLQLTIYLGEKNGYRTFLDEDLYRDNIAKYISQGTSTVALTGMRPTITYLGVFAGDTVSQPPIDLGRNKYSEVIEVKVNGEPNEFVFDLPSRPNAKLHEKQVLEISIVGPSAPFNFTLDYLEDENPNTNIKAPQDNPIHFFKFSFVSDVSAGIPYFNGAIRYRYDPQMLPNVNPSTISFYLLKSNSWSEFNAQLDKNLDTHYITQGTTGGQTSPDLNQQQFYLGILSDGKTGPLPSFPPAASSSPGPETSNPNPGHSTPNPGHSTPNPGHSQTPQKSNPPPTHHSNPPPTHNSQQPRVSDSKVNNAAGTMVNMSIFIAALLCYAATMFVF